MTPSLPPIEAFDAVPREEIPAVLTHLAALQAALAARLADRDPAPADPTPDYLQLGELARRIDYSPGTIRNLISAGTLLPGIHFERRRGRLIFRWVAMERWLREQTIAPRGSNVVPLPQGGRRGRA